MKRAFWTATFALLVLPCLGAKSCEKSEWERVYDPDANEPCTSDAYQDWDAVGDDHLKHVVWPLEESAECNCPVAGLLKYRQKDDKGNLTVALVDYGDGACDGWAIKTLCVDGDCAHELATTCKFAVDCDGIAVDPALQPHVDQLVP